MESISSDVLNIIRAAIRLEINGKNFFDFASDETQNSLGKKMFKKLSNDEVQHLKVFSELFTEALNTDEWKRFVSNEEKNASTVIEELKSRVRRSEGKGEQEALRIGMELEQKAIDFFEKSARETGNKKASEICKKICDEERWHFDLLQSQLDSLTNTGIWIDSAEFRMDGKY